MTFRNLPPETVASSNSIPLRELWEQFDIFFARKKTVELEENRLEKICLKCKSVSFVESTDCVSNEIVCTHCGEVQFGSFEENVSCVRSQGRTLYDPLERFRFWIELAQGNGKIPPALLKICDSFSCLSDLKSFLLLKQNRKYRKYYGCILKKWEPDLVQPLSSEEKQGLEINFNHLLRIHKNENKRNSKTGRKKSLPHYTFLIEIFLRKIGRDDLALNFLPMKCKKIYNSYIELINTVFTYFLAFSCFFLHMYGTIDNRWEYEEQCLMLFFRFFLREFFSFERV